MSIALPGHIQRRKLDDHPRLARAEIVRLVENTLIRGCVVPLLEHDHPRLAQAARTCARTDL